MTGEESSAELVLHGGPIRTLDPSRPLAGAIAIREGRIVGIGRAEDAMRWGGPGTRRVDLQGRMVMPGLIDLHIHLYRGAASRLYEVALSPTLDFAEILDRVGQAAAAPSSRTWIVAGPFGRAAEAAMRDQAARERLDAVSNGRPVVMNHISAHARFANSLALELAGIDAETANPPHGEIVRDSRSGQPTGYLIEAAGTAVRDAVPPLAEAERVAAAKYGVALLNRLGITGFVDAAASVEMLQAFKALDDAGDLNAWASFCLPATANIVGPAWTEEMIERRAELCGRHMLADFGKLFLDGVASLKTAAMIDPYPSADGSEAADRGELLLSLDEVTRHIAAFDKRGMSMKTHAIGDRAIRTLLDAVERVRKMHGTTATPHQLAHGNFIRAEDVARLKALNVVADLNPPLWFPSPTSLAQEQAVGSDRYAHAWPIRDIVESGALAATGTDWPAIAAEPDPWISMAGIVTRRDLRGNMPGIHRPDQALDVEAALPLYTRNPAIAMGRGQDTGMLAQGRSADLVLLDRDLCAIPGEDIARTQVLATLFEGRVVHGAL